MLCVSKKSHVFGYLSTLCVHCTFACVGFVCSSHGIAEHRLYSSCCCNLLDF